MGIDHGGKAYVAEDMQETMIDILGPLGYHEGKSYNIYFKYGIIMV